MWRKLEPEQYYGYEGQALVYFRQGKYEASIQASEQALKFRPHQQTYLDFGTAYFYAGRHNEAMKMFEKAVELEANNELYLGNLADAYRRAGQKERRRRDVRPGNRAGLQGPERQPSRHQHDGQPGARLREEGRAGAGLRTDRPRWAIDAADVDLLYTEAVVHAIAGRAAEAIASLRAAFERGYSPAQALREPDLEKLSKLSDFQRLTREFAARR